MLLQIRNLIGLYLWLLYNLYGVSQNHRQIDPGFCQSTQTGEFLMFAGEWAAKFHLNTGQSSWTGRSPGEGFPRCSCVYSVDRNPLTNAPGRRMLSTERRS